MSTVAVVVCVLEVLSHGEGIGKGGRMVKMKGNSERAVFCVGCSSWVVLVFFL